MKEEKFLELTEIDKRACELRKEIAELEVKREEVLEQIQKSELEDLLLDDISLDYETSGQKATLLFDKFFNNKVWKNLSIEYGITEYVEFTSYYIENKNSNHVILYGRLMRMEDNIDPYEALEEGKVDFKMEITDNYENSIDLSKICPNSPKNTLGTLICAIEKTYELISSEGWEKVLSGNKFNIRQVINYQLDKLIDKE